MIDPDEQRLRWIEKQAGVYDDEEGGTWEEPDTVDWWER